MMIILLFSGCSSKVEEEPVILEDFIANINEERKEDISMPLKYSAKHNVVYYDSELDLDYDELMKLTTPADIDSITKDEAIADADILFQLLRASYGAYKYFGDDRVFNNVKTGIEEELRLQDTWKTEEFLDILLEKLSFLEDTHFSLNGQRTYYNEIYLYADNEKREFHKDSYGYYTEIDNKKWYLEKENEALLKPTIGESGELVYGIFALSSEDESKELPSNITITRGKKSLHHDLTWKIASAGEPLGTEDNVYHYDEIDGIPVASIRSLFTSDAENEDILRFIRDADKMRDKEAAILDLRKNAGGFQMINELWLYRFTDQIVLPKVEMLTRVNNLPKGGEYDRSIVDNLQKYEYQLDFYNEYTKARQELNNDIINAEYTNYYTIIRYNPRFLDRDNILFVLVDKDTYSAAEMFLFQLKTVENVVFVGTNSNGCLISDITITPYYLPNSRIKVTFGNELFVTNSMENYDAIGMMPDIYIDGEDALDAVFRCIKYYDLLEN